MANATTPAARQPRSTASLCYYETDKLDELATRELAETPRRNSPSTCSSTTPPRTAISRHPGRTRAARRAITARLRTARACPTTAARRLSTRATSTTSRALRPRSALSDGLSEIHTLPRLPNTTRRSPRCAELTTASVRSSNTLGALHRLRNTYIIFTSDNGFFYGEHRLVGGKVLLAYEPSTHLPFLIRGPGIKPGRRTERARRQHRHRADDPRPRPREGRIIRASTAVRFTPSPTIPRSAPCRPILFESFVESNDVEENGGNRLRKPLRRPEEGRPIHPGEAKASTARSPQPRQRGKPRPRSSLRPRTTTAPVLGPYKYIEWPDGEKELYDLETDPYELNNRVRDPKLLPRSAPSCTANSNGWRHVQVRSAENCRSPYR